MIVIVVRKIQAVRQPLIFNMIQHGDEVYKNCDLLCGRIHHNAAPTSLLVEQLQYTVGLLNSCSQPLRNCYIMRVTTFKNTVFYFDIV